MCQTTTNAHNVPSADAAAAAEKAELSCPSQPISNYEPIDFGSLGLEWKHEENESKDPRAVRMASECRKRLTKATQNCIDAILARKVSEGVDGNERGTLGLILSGGVDTCAILEAATSLGIVFDFAVTVVIGETSPDELYSKYAAWKHGLTDRHIVIKMSPEDLIDVYLPRTIETLEVWDGMTVRNSLVISAAFETAKAHGITDVLVGDGADELFGGYTFTWGDANDPVGWKAKRDKMCQNWTFATDDLAASYGLIAHAPYEDQEVMVDWALAETQRVDCIADERCLIQLTLGQEYNLHTTGKVLLRESFRTGSSWRRKDPIEKGSGATVIGHNDYWTKNHGITDAEFEDQQKRWREIEGVILQSKEYLVNIRIYCDVFGGLVHPTRKRLPGGENSCIGCGFELDRVDAMFCHMCGAYPARKIAKE